MNDDEFRDLIELVHQIQQLTEQKGWALLQDRAAATMGPRQKQLLNGNMDSMEKYQHQVGWLQGATFVMQIPELVKIELERERQARAEIQAEQEAQAA